MYTHMQFLVARSQWIIFCSARCSITLATPKANPSKSGIVSDCKKDENF